MIANGLTQDQAQAMINKSLLCVANGAQLSNGTMSCLPAPNPLASDANSAGFGPPGAILSLLMSKANNAPSLTVSQWNYYYTQLVPGANTNVDLGDGGVGVSAQQFLALRAAKGLSGLGFIMPAVASASSQPIGVAGLGAQPMRAAKRSPWGRLPAGGYIQ